MEFREIKKLVELFSTCQIDSLELSRDGFSIKLAKKGRRHGTQAASPVGYGPGLAEATPPEVAVSTAPEAGSVAAEDETSDLQVVTSPVVGTFYAAPNPKAEPFVSPGDSIRVGQTLCIVEAMKLMNEIQSDVAGELVTCYVDNAQPVEFGQKLFAIKPF